MRAFLSHRSTDKAFVQQVAEALGRSHVVYDVFEFATGDDFHNAIRVGLSRSGLLVLFASKNSLSTRHSAGIDWVRLELDSASQRLGEGKLANAVCYIIDDEVGIDDVPRWLTRGLVTRQSNPLLVALDIRRLINQTLQHRRPHFYVGRSREADEILEVISGQVSPLIVYGLQGIGRRTFIEQTARNHLSYQKTLPIELRPGDELPELMLKLKTRLGLLDISEAQVTLASFSALSVEAQATAVCGLLQEVCSSGTLPVIVDTGSLGDEHGNIFPGAQTLFDLLSNDRRTDLAVIAQRRLRNVLGNPLPSVRIRELDAPSAQKLIRLLANYYRITLDRNQLEAFSTYIAGYPPAAAFAIEEIRAYGVDYVLGNQRVIVNFNRSVFLKGLSTNERITPAMRDILQLLSSYSPLPLAAVSEYLDKRTDEEIDDALTHLIDLALVTPSDLHYAVSAPVRDTCYNLYGGLLVNHSKVAAKIEGFLEQNAEYEGRLELAQLLFRAIHMAGRNTASKLAVGLASDLINLATQSYYDENYDSVIKYGDMAVAARPNNVDVRRVVAQALIRRERWDEAEMHIEHMVAIGAPKEAFYVRGFLERKRQRNREAVGAYKRAIEYGRRGVAVHRELAQCYFQLADLDNAKTQIRLAEEASPHNRFVVDLKCTIATKLGDRPEVFRCLQLLEKIDTGGFAFHRRSRFELSEGNQVEALKYAKLAFEQAFRPSFEIAANLANCLIECGREDEASIEIRALDQKFSSTHADARLGLHCKLELRRGDVTMAEAFWNRFGEKEAPVHIGLRRSILKLRQASVGLSALEEAELAGISTHLDFVPDALDLVEE